MHSVIVFVWLANKVSIMRVFHGYFTACTYFFVFFDITMSPHIQNRSMTVRRIVIHDNTGALFEEALPQISTDISDSVDELLKYCSI